MFNINSLANLRNFDIESSIYRDRGHILNLNQQESFVTIFMLLVCAREVAEMTDGPLVSRFPAFPIEIKPKSVCCAYSLALLVDGLLKVGDPFDVGIKSVLIRLGGLGDGDDGVIFQFTILTFSKKNRCRRIVLGRIN